MPKQLKAKNTLYATRVDRIAVVDRGAVPDAEILVFKRLKEENIEKGVTAFSDLPLADKTHAWDASAAVSRIRKWAGGPDKEKVSWTKYKKAFMWVNSQDADNYAAYKLPYADIIDGQLKAVPRAIIAIVQVLAGGRGGVKIPTEDKRKVLTHCKKYYKKMGTKFPEITIKILEKGMFAQQSFYRRFVIRGTFAAVETLMDSVWDAIYGDAEDVGKNLKESFADFKSVVKDVLAKIMKKEKINKDAREDKLTKDEVSQSFARGLSITAIMEGFSYFKCSMGYLMSGYNDMEEPDETLEEVMNQFEKFVIENGTEIVANKRDSSWGDEMIEKEGRTISDARLRKLKAALSVLNDVVQETETRYSKQNKEVGSMEELKEILEKVNKISTSVEEISKTVKTHDDVLKERKYIQTEDEIKKAADAKVVADKKLADDKVIADKKIADDKVVEDKKIADDAVEKKKVDDAKEDRLVKIEGSVEKFGKLADLLEKKIGVKTGLDEGDEGSGEGEGDEDIFAKTLKDGELPEKK